MTDFLTPGAIWQNSGPFLAIVFDILAIRIGPGDILPVWAVVALGLLLAIGIVGARRLRRLR